MIVLLVVSVVVLALSVLGLQASDSSVAGRTFGPSIVAAIWLVVYLVTTHRAFGTLYLFTTTYVVCLVAFHFGQVMQDGFGLVDILWTATVGMDVWVVRAAWFTNVALACLGMGFAVRSLTSANRPAPPADAARVVGRQNLAWLYDIGIGLLIASVILLFAAFASFGNLLALTRLELFHLSDTRFISVFSMMAPSSAIALVLGAQTKGQRNLSYAVSCAVLLVFLLSGQRGTAFFPLLAGAVLWVKVGRRVSPLVAASAVLAVLFVIPIVGYLRTLGTYSEILSTQAVEEAIEYADISAALSEMGGSIGPLVFALKLIPAEEPYRYGRTYADYLLDLVPNVGLTPDKSTSRAAIIEMLRSQGRDKALMAMNVGDWASYHIIPEQFESGGGAGFSGVAEPYFNFGSVGVVFFFLILGAFLCTLESRSLVLDRNWLLFGVIAYWHLLPTVRNGFAVFSKPAFFTLMAVFLWLLFRRFVPRSPLAAESRRASRRATSLVR